jgi:hypothetical protein
MRRESNKNILFKPYVSLLAVATGAAVGVGATHALRAPALRAAATGAQPAGTAAGARPVVSVDLAKAISGHRAKPFSTDRAQTPDLATRPVRIGAARATISLYERTTYRSVLGRQGCSAAQRGVGGIVILDFGQPAYNGHTYGTNLFSGRFAGNAEITRGLLSYAHGYARCLRRGSTLAITLARGTSNYRPQVPNAYAAGHRWARETHRLAQLLRKDGLDSHVSSAAADDVEPAWDRTFHRTRDFFRGYRAASMGHLLYNYGSLDGGVGSIWNARQAFFVASGMKYARAIPEIYNPAMARQWAELAHIAKHVYHRPVQFAGVMTTHTSANHGMKPRDAHTSLVRALAATVGSEVDVPPTLTNIRSAE